MTPDRRPNPNAPLVAFLGATFLGAVLLCAVVAFLQPSSPTLLAPVVTSYADPVAPVPATDSGLGPVIYQVHTTSELPLADLAAALGVHPADVAHSNPNAPDVSYVVTVAPHQRPIIEAHLRTSAHIAWWQSTDSPTSP